MDQNTSSPEQSPTNPLVVTLAMSSSAQLYFNKLRQEHFPANRNYLHAHLTVFHAVPNIPRIEEELKAYTKMQQPFEVTAQAIVSLGFGTAIKIESPKLPLIHQYLQKSWFDILTHQDRQKRNFHITVQNKVEPHLARKLQAELAQDFEPFTFMIEGIQLWRYMGGPWAFQSQFNFGTVTPDA